MTRGPVCLALVVVLLGGGTAVAGRLHPVPVGPPVTTPLIESVPAAVPVCPGPQTLVPVAGGIARAEPGPVVVGAVVAAPGVAAPPGTPAAVATRAADAPPTAELVATPGVPGGPVVTRALLSGGARAARSGVVVGTLAPSVAGGVRVEIGAGAGSPSVGATQLSMSVSGSGAGDLRGLVAAACPVAATDSWLVGGGTVTGRRALLVLANPASVAAVVDVTVHGPQGPVPTSQGAGLVVPAGGQTALSIDAMAPGLSAIAVHVHALSGRVSASLLDSLVRGLTPGGADAVSPGAGPAEQQTVAGLSVAAPAPAPGAESIPSVGTGAAPPMGTDPSAPGADAIRIAVPGTTDAVVRIHLIGSSGAVDLPGEGVVTVAAGSVRDIPVVAVPDGDYAAVVDADQPVLASALVGRSSAGSAAASATTPGDLTIPPAELAWAPGSVPLRGTTALAVPLLPAGRPGVTLPAPTRRLVLAAPGPAARVLVAQVRSDGFVSPVRTLVVAAGSVSTLALDPGSVGLLLTPDPGASAPVVAAVVLQAADRVGQLISVLPVTPAPPRAGGVRTASPDPMVGLD